MSKLASSLRGPSATAGSGSKHMKTIAPHTHTQKPETPETHVHIEGGALLGGGGNATNSEKKQPTGMTDRFIGSYSLHLRGTGEKVRLDPPWTHPVPPSLPVRLEPAVRNCHRHHSQTTRGDGLISASLGDPNAVTTSLAAPQLPGSKARHVPSASKRHSQRASSLNARDFQGEC